jgi:hypothetical protein
LDQHARYDFNTQIGDDLNPNVEGEDLRDPIRPGRWRERAPFAGTRLRATTDAVNVT